MTNYPKHLVLIGCGNMAGSILSRWLECGVDPTTVTVIDPYRKEVPPGVTLLEFLPDALPQGATILLGIKPQQLGQVAPALHALWHDDMALVSMLAGVPVAQLRLSVAPAGAVVRIMPNTPVALGQGVVALYADDCTPQVARDAVSALMQPLGLVEWMEREDQFNLLTALSGCGPAYVFRFIDALAQAATQLGMEEGQAQRLALATVRGSASLAHISEDSPGLLAEKVASPGGMTREGLNVMDESGRLSALLLETLRAAQDKGEELARLAGA